MSESKPFEVEVVSTSAALEAMTRGQVDIQVATAKRYPRSIGEVRDRVIQLATQSVEVAEACWYSLPRAGKVIEGPSIRLAEILAASYQNLRAGARVIGIDDKYVTVQGACWDMENNVAIEVEVKRRITDKNGKRYADDMIVVTTNAACSIAIRNAIFKVVPQALLAGMSEEIKKVAMGDARTFRARLAACVEHFKSMGVEEKRLLTIVNRKTREDVTMDDLATLRGLATAIKDGDTTVDESFAATNVPAMVGKVDAGAIKAAAPEPKPSEPATKQTKKEA
ncbi:hypothetical protein KKH23_04785 [Patescibacteria group bacterium]|nr:hypothetical protein [Patescibacteria group bacterium]